MTAGGTLHVDTPLQLGQVIEVSAAVSTVQTDNAKVSTLVDDTIESEVEIVLGAE